MFIIRFPYSHQYKRVIVIVYWSDYPDGVIFLLYNSLHLHMLLVIFFQGKNNVKRIV